MLNHPAWAVRWFLYRGWALISAVLLAFPAWALQPPFPLDGSGWPHQMMFGVAAGAYLVVGIDPERYRLRLLAACLGTFATALRAWTLMLDEGLPIRVRIVGVSAWGLAMLWLAASPEFTERYTKGTRARWWE